MIQAEWHLHTLKFKQPSGTSRGILKQKNTWFIQIYDDTNPEIEGIGECGMLKGLSIDDVPDYEKKLEEVCNNIGYYLINPKEKLADFPSILFGIEMALLSLQNENPFILFPSDFNKGKKGIDINGLIWMGEKEFMFEQIKEKLKTGFTCIKLKIGAIDFEQELSLLAYIRAQFSAKEVEIRVDANGAFSPNDALEKLSRLSEFELHSIEQPIRQKQWVEMAELCEKTPLAIALDEELIGIKTKKDKEFLLSKIKPQYIILKPSLVGGFAHSQEWIDLAKAQNIGWWITSALESNVGLNAIAQWTYTLRNAMPQGLGTGQLYTNNIPSPLVIRKAKLFYDNSKKWRF